MKDVSKMSPQELRNEVVRLRADVDGLNQECADWAAQYSCQTNLLSRWLRVTTPGFLSSSDIEKLRNDTKEALK